MLERPGANPSDSFRALLAGLRGRRRIVAVTGAGVSSEAGIPDYRDAAGRWKRPAPVQFAEFLSSAAVRQRYWARSMSGWPAFSAARPTPAHAAFAVLERAGLLMCTVSQNVDDLHRRAGSRRVLDLHGRLARVRCMACGRRSARRRLQAQLADANPDFAVGITAAAPDGDADLGATDWSEFRVPACAGCAGVLKPDVTFYGETLPRERSRRADAAVAAADALLVAGSSLMVFSAFRLVRAAARRGIPIVAVNLGRTRADDLLDVKLVGRAGAVLPALAARLAAAA